MVAFWTLAALMAALALAFVLVPLLRARAVPGPSSREAALEVLRGQRREIESDIAAGHLSADAREEALAELVERAGEDLVANEPTRAPLAGRPWPIAIALAVAIPALAFGVYSAIGTPSATDLRSVAVAAHSGTDKAQLIAMIESLAQKVRERPEDAQGWALLARSMAAIGKFQEAADAYEHLARLVPNDAQVLADWSDALGMAQGRSLRGRPTELALKALEIDPTHQKALALSGTAAMDAGDYAKAMDYWQRISVQLPPGSEDASRIETIIAEVRERASAAGKPLPASTRVAQAAPAKPNPAPAPTPSAAPAKTMPPPAPAKAGASATTAPAQSVTGSVALDAALKEKVTGGETLWVLARAENGPRVPLAVMRASAGSLPIEFALDDSQSMAPGMNISSVQALRVEARISRSGNATTQAGDLVGTSGVIKPGARGVKIVVDKVVP